MIKRLLLSAALSLSVVAPVQAQSGLEQIVRMDVLDGGPTAHGTYIAALRLTLSDGWKTYWRAPGDAGIPPEFNWRGSRNLGAVSINWPSPKVFDQNGMTSVGYTDQLVLPVEIAPVRAGEPVHLQGQMHFGICKDVCIPGTLSIDHQLDKTADRNPTIAAALAQRPYSESEAGVSSATCRLSPIGGGMRLEAKIMMPSAGGREFAVIEPGVPEVWVSEAETQRRGNTLVAVSDLVHVNKGSYALDRSQIRITVLGSNHSVDIQGCAPG